MSRNKKILLAVGGVAAGLLVALLVLPLLFVDRIEARIRSEIERSTRLRVSWSDVGLGFFRDFPNPALTLRDLAVVGTGSFDGDTLAAVGDFRLSLSGPSLIRAVRGTGALEVRSVRLDEPRLRLRVDEEGIASWDVLPDRVEGVEGEAVGEVEGEGASREGGEGPGVAVSLRSLEVMDGSVLVEHAPSGLFLAVEGLRHSLSGDFSRESLVARTTTHSDATTLRFAGVPYLERVSLDFDGAFDVDMSGRRARLVENELRLNDLIVRLDGELAREDEGVAMDLAFTAPSTEFGQILSLVPVVYARDFASLETSGTFSLDGTVGGAWGPESFPSFDVLLNVADGSFRYPDLPLPARAIAADLAVTNPGGDVDSTVVDLSRFHVEIGDETLDAALVLRTPVSDPDVDARVQGTLDLGDVARTVKLEGSEGLAGVIVADAHVRARRSDVENGRHERIAAEGSISARGVALPEGTLRQPVEIREARIRLTTRTAELSTFDARLGSSDLQATGRLDNLLAFALGAGTLSGAAAFTSSRFVLDEWRSDDAELSAIPVPAMLDLTLDGTIGELVFNGLEMTNARGRAIVRDERLTLEGFTLETLGGRVAVDGYYETLDAARPTFALGLGLDSIDVAGAAEQVLTVRALAPVARYARGTFSTTLDLSGALGQDMAPQLDVLDGDGALSTSRILIEDFPLLDLLAETLQLQRLSNPTLNAVRSRFHIEDGRLVVEPFQVTAGGLGMTVSGSTGIDQSLDYAITLRVPRSGFADDALGALAAKAGPLGPRLSALDTIPVTARVTGTVTRPSLDLALSEAAGSARAAAIAAATAEVEEQLEEARRRLDEEREQALQRAREQADSIVAAAERQAETIRAEAARAAAEVRTQGDRAAEELLARATNPIARVAAEAAADRLRQEAGQRAADIEREADERATALVAEARARADALVGT